MQYDKVMMTKNQVTFTFSSVYIINDQSIRVKDILIWRISIWSSTPDLKTYYYYAESDTSIASDKILILR